MTVCYGSCPDQFKDIGLFCQKPSPYGRGIGKISESACVNSGNHGASTNGCEEYAGLWYPKCDKGFHNFGCCVCTPDCPDGYVDTGTGCTKPRYDGGTGSIPSIFSSGTLTIIAIVFVIIILLFYSHTFTFPGGNIILPQMIICQIFNIVHFLHKMFD